MKDKLQSHVTLGQVRRCLHVAVIFSIIGIAAGFWIGKHQSPTMKDLIRRLQVLKTDNDKLGEKVASLDGAILEVAKQADAIQSLNVDLLTANIGLNQQNLTLTDKNKDLWEDYTDEIKANVALKAANMGLESKVLTTQAEVLECETNCETICDAKWATKWNSAGDVKARLTELSQFARQQQIADWHRRDRISGNRGFLYISGQWSDETLHRSKSWLTFY